MGVGEVHGVDDVATLPAVVPRREGTPGRVDAGGQVTQPRSPHRCRVDVEGHIGEVGGVVDANGLIGEGGGHGRRTAFSVMIPPGRVDCPLAADAYALLSFYAGPETSSGPGALRAAMRAR